MQSGIQSSSTGSFRHSVIHSKGSYHVAVVLSLAGKAHIHTVCIHSITMANIQGYQPNTDNAHMGKD